jgi:hypothetical protein
MIKNFFENVVNHDILITKLEYCGVVGIFGELIKSYLSERHQRVLIKSRHYSNYVSALERIRYGVPQPVKGLAESTPVL